MLRCSFIVVFTAIAAHAFAQNGDTTWYDAQWKKTLKPGATYFRTKPVRAGEYFRFTDYYANGNIQMQGHSARPDSTAWIGKVNWYYPDGTLKQSASYKDQKLSDSFFSYHPNGSLETVAFYKDGRFQGTALQYDSTGQRTTEYLFDDGSLRQVRYYRDNKLRVAQSYLGNGILHGETLEYSEEGILVSREMYRNGRRHGVSEAFYPSGMLKEKRTYLDGELDGTWQQFFESGLLREQSNYLNGELQARVESFNEDGSLVKSAEYLQGRQHGLAVPVSANGSRYKSFYRDDQLDSTCGLYSKTGDPLIEASFHSGVLHGSLLLHLPGEFKTEAAFDNGSLVYWKSYHTNGKPYRFATMNTDSLVEEWTTFDADGNRIMETAYRFNDQYGTWKRYVGNELVFRLDYRTPLLEDDLRYRRDRLLNEKKKQDNYNEEDNDEENDEEDDEHIAVTPEEIRNITGVFTDITELIPALPRRFFVPEDAVMNQPDPYNMEEYGRAAWLFANGNIELVRDFNDYQSKPEVKFHIAGKAPGQLVNEVQIRETTSAAGLDLIAAAENARPSGRQLLVFIEHPSESVLKVLRFAMTAKLKNRLRKDPAAVVGICNLLHTRHSAEYTLADITYALCTELYTE